METKILDIRDVDVSFGVFFQAGLTAPIPYLHWNIEETLSMSKTVLVYFSF